MTLHLDSFQAFELLAAMEAFGAEPVLVDAAALALLRCAGVGVDAPDPLPGRAAAENVTVTLGLALPGGVSGSVLAIVSFPEPTRTSGTWKLSLRNPLEQPGRKSGVHDHL